MKDRFKFRVWNIEKKDNKKATLDDIDLLFGKYFCCAEIYDEKSFVIEQCTGLKDKNGKLIYEGDILATSNTQPEAAEDYWTKEQYGYTTVVWNDKFLCFTCTEWNFEPFGVDSVYSLDFVEVVGNIHENPELLER